MRWQVDIRMFVFCVVRLGTTGTVKQVTNYDMLDIIIIHVADIGRGFVFIRSREAAEGLCKVACIISDSACDLVQRQVKICVYCRDYFLDPIVRVSAGEPSAANCCRFSDVRIRYPVYGHSHITPVM